MAEAASKITVSQPPYDEDDLPLPPPPPVPPRPLDYEGSVALTSLPVPPPKETFSTFYQQRQKSELKRLFKHIHPDLRASLDDAVDDEILKAVQAESSQAGDAAYQCEVQSMRWIFENWTLDNIGDPHGTKKLLDDEELQGGDVRSTSSMFEQIDSTQCRSTKRQTSVRGDVRTSMWLFETQPLDSLNKSKSEEGELVEAVLKEPIQTGDVRGNRLLFESKPLSDLGRCNSIEDYSFLKLKSELQELKGDVQTTVKLFQTEPGCAIRDNSGNIHEIKSICREEISSGKTSTARWLFETQPLDLINKGSDGVKIIRGISLEEGHGGGFDKKRWMFETQSFDAIQEALGVDRFEGSVPDYTGEADVINKRKLFETQPLATLKGDAAEQSPEKEAIIGGDVKTSLWLFETQPMDALSDSCEVGRLQKITLSSEEQGAVKGKKQIFESCGIDKTSLFKEQEIEKGDVKGFKQLFETIPLSKIAQSEEAISEKKITVEGGNVKANKEMFETSPLYAIKDSSGSLHEVTTVSREESIKGKVKNYKWMFETKPLDQLVERNVSVEVIKGITRQEDSAGDVKMAKWLFETQTIDGIHGKFNQTEQTPSTEEEPCKGDVKTCKWLFETKPMDILYDKSEKPKDKDSIDSTNVKSITWLFESQPLESIKESEPYNLKLCSTIQDPVKSEVAFQTVKHLFETETLDRIRKNSDSKLDLRCISQVDFQSGDVSRVKELFESQSLDEIGSELVATSGEQNQDDNIEKGSVHRFTWMFENCPMNQINKDCADANTEEVEVLESGDVQNKKFVFETSSLDKIHEEPLEERPACVEEPVSNVDVKSSTMMFESMPLYAIRDKEGQFHEVTTVKKEEVMSADVRGARWMFETKPLDAIKAENEVYVIRAVTQEDVKKGDVKSARWKFETQPLDSFTSPDEPYVRVTEDFGSSSVQQSKKMFESGQSCDKFVRMVSVTDVQRGDVRTSTWLFENQAMDSLRGEPQEQSPVKTVHREDSQKGDVKRCTWLFESQQLDKIKEPEDTSVQGVEEIPKADVKCTTWLFETTPLDKITTTSVADTLSRLHEMDVIHSSGIIIEANESRSVNMAKYLYENKESVQIQKEDLIKGNIRNIMLQLLLKPTLKPQVTLLREAETGKLNATVMELPVLESAANISIESDQRIRNIAQTIDETLIYDANMKKGIVMQETGEGQAEMLVYSLISHCETKTESLITEKGDVKSTIGNLLATANSQRASAFCRVDESEKGNVNLYKSCIEKGDLQYLKNLHAEDSECEADLGLVAKEPIETIEGGVREAKRSLCQQKEQVERTICDVLPGDVKNTKRVFSSDCAASVDSCLQKEEIIPGDITSAMQQLTVKPLISVEKEEIVPGDIKATLESLKRAKQQSMCVEREIVKPGTIYDMDLSAQDPFVEGSQSQKEVIVSGDVKAAKKSLEMAKQQSMHLEREVIIPGKIYNISTSAQAESSSTVAQSACSSSSRCQQIRTYPKVSIAEKDQGSHASFEACEQRAVVVSNNAQDSPPSYIGHCFNGQTSEDEAEEVVRGDVKAAIRSLQSAATEQKFLDKENIVRGNMQSALESLEKSSVNVSKGDYKAAMIYRNSSKGCSGRSKTVHNQCVVVSVPPSDTKLSPSISVTCEGQPAITTQTPTPRPVVNGKSKSAASERVTPPPPPEKNERAKEQKPALPPKPQWMKSVVVEGPNISLTPAPKVISHLEDNMTNAVPPPKRSPQIPAHSTDKRQEMAPCQKASKGSSRQTHSTRTNEGETKQKNETAPSTETTSDRLVLKSHSKETEIERNVIQKINAAEEIQMCMKNHAEDGKQEMNMSLQAALQNFERKDGGVLDRGALRPKTVKVIDSTVSENRGAGKTAEEQRKCHQNPPKTRTSQAYGSVEMSQSQQKAPHRKEEGPGDKVVMREKKGRETEDERRQRLSVHKDEIMKGNMNAAMEIFENLRKREELKGVLSQVEEIEGEACTVDDSPSNTLYVNVPSWMVKPSRNAKQSKVEEKKVEAEAQDDDLESISSVEMAFEDLEKASKDIMKLKEQTLSKLLDIEETIKKALYSVSNLKSEADIAGLSGLFDESLKSEQNLLPVNNRKISIVSRKNTSGSVKGTADSGGSLPTKEGPKQACSKPLIRQSSQSSPSFISIHSARKPSEQPKPAMSTFKPDHVNQDPKPKPEASEVPRNGLGPQRKVSHLEVKAVPEPAAGIIGTKTISETYEESDGFGNVFVSSTTSTFVTNHSGSKAPAVFEVVGGPAAYEAAPPPSPRRPGHLFEDKVRRSSNQEGTVFVTFCQSKEKH
ncbi:xin actin-binding repeat-containing protein 1 isoform 2-T3 [Menidia menidia]